jgi:multidrug efflux pump
VEAVRIRLRPIIMTSLAFVFGVLPLAISNGAGSGSQHAIGTGVIGGMIVGTVLGLFFIPLFFVATDRCWRSSSSRCSSSHRRGHAGHV